MMKTLNLIVAFLLFFSIGGLLTTANAENPKNVQVKGKPSAAKPGPNIHGPVGNTGINHGITHGNIHDGHEGHGAGVHHFAGHDFHHMNEHDQRLWRGGNWHHEEYMGRMGYWWIVGGVRYFYDAPVYPYPVVVAPVMYEIPVATVAVPVERPAPVFVPQAQTVRYYCPGVGYAPAVQNCPNGWVTQPM